MIGTYASAALICAASLLVGRAILSLAGRRSWSWLEPAVGFAAILTVTGALARAPGHGTSATLGAAALVVVAAAVAFRRPYAARGELRAGVSVAIVVLLALAIPFAVSGRWGLLGVGFNNDLGLHLAWAEWLRSGFGPAPDAGYPLGPHGLAVAVAAVPGIGLGQAFVGEIVAIGLLTGLTALAAVGGLGPVRRTVAATMVAVPYLAASYFAQGAFKETAEALFVLAFALLLAAISRDRRIPPISAGDSASSPDAQRLAQRDLSGKGALLPALALSGGVFFSYSFAGLAWPVAIAVLWGLGLPEVRRALRPRSVLRFLLRPATLLTIAVLAGLAVVLTIVGPFGFAHGFNKVAGSNTYGPVSPLEALGIWPAANYRLEAEGGAHLTGLDGAVAILALLVAVAWWVRRREATIPLALAGGTLLYLASLPSSGDYSQAKALMIIAPLAMLVVVRPLVAEFPGPRRGSERTSSRIAGETASSRRGSGLARVAWAVLAVAFLGGAAYSSFLALRDAPVGPPGHGAELEAFLPILHGKPVLYAGQDRYAAYDLLGADTHVPLVEFPDPAVAPNEEKPFDTGDAYSPIDFDSFSRGTLDRFPYVITSRGAGYSHAPPKIRPGAPELPARRLDPLLRPLAAHRADAGRPARAARGHRGGGQRRLRLAGDPDPALAPRPRLALPGRRDRAQIGLGRRQRPRHRRRDLADAGPPGRQLEPLDPVLLPLRPHPLGPRLQRTAEGRPRRPAPQHDQPRQQRPVLARGPLREPGRQGPVHDRHRRPHDPAGTGRLRRQGLPR
jgi:hypothetical protein